MNTILEFLTDLRSHNNREWFNANKDNYLQAREQFEDTVNGLIAGIRKFDPEIGPLTAGDCVFRIYRDVRFSHDKSPYKTNMGGFIAKGGRKAGYAGYYLHIDPDGSFLAGGSHMPPPDRLKLIRQEIIYNVGEFKEIINAPGFRKTFGALEGDRLSRPPKDFPADFPDIDLLKFKSYTVMHTLAPGDLLSQKFMAHATATFRELHPLVKFLNRALS